MDFMRNHSASVNLIDKVMMKIQLTCTTLNWEEFLLNWD